MALRNRSPLKRCSDGSAEKNNSSASTTRSKRRTSLKRVAVKLVSSDPALAQFLQATTPSQDEKSLEKDRDAAAAKLEKAIDSLGKLEAEVIAALFPTSSDNPETFESLAKRLGMTVEEVKSVADNALRGLRGSRRGALRVSTVWN